MGPARVTLGRPVAASLLATLLIAAALLSARWMGTRRLRIHAAVHHGTAPRQSAAGAVAAPWRGTARHGPGRGTDQGAARTGVPPLPPPIMRQFACVTATASHRHPLTKAMRGWRRGIPTLVLTNATGPLLVKERAEGRRYNETWMHYPDSPGFNVTRKAGDPRAAVGPALVLRKLGADFKWLIYGDDDVAFFWPGLLRALQGLDPNDPYFLSDNYYSYWLGDNQTGIRRQGRLDQPRCVPCTADDTGLDLVAARALKTCNCSVGAMHDAFRAVPTRACFMRRAGAFCPPIWSISGGAGAVLSIGLLRRLDPAQYTSCVHGGQTVNGVPKVAGGGDGLLTNCLWEQGFGYTDPGFELRHKGLLTFNMYQNRWFEMDADLMDALAGDCQDEQCRLRLDSAVSVHTGGAWIKNYKRTSGYIAGFLDNAAGYAAAHADVAGLAARLRG